MRSRRFYCRPTRGRGVVMGLVSTLDAEARGHGISKVNTMVIELAELHERDIHDLYALLEDAQDGRTHISQRVAMDSRRSITYGGYDDSQGSMDCGRRMAYAFEWLGFLMDWSQATHQELQTHHDHVWLRPSSGLIDMRREMSDIQVELLAHREQQRRARRSGPDARILDHQDASGDADSHI
ncbi:hypothetical protein Tco_0296263 [Tanacetum coccineum]